MVHRVVGGVLVDGGRALLGHRRADRRYYPDCWDVLGGHVEPGETPEAALVRELREEAGIDAAVVGPPALHLEDDPLHDDGMILDVWIVTEWSGNPTNLAQDEHDELRWVSLEDLPHLELAHPSYPTFLLDLLNGASDWSEIRTERLLLRRPTSADAPFVLILHSDSRSTEYNPADALRDLAEARARLELWSSHWEQGLGYWIVEEAASATPIGVCGVKAVDLHGGRAWNLLYRFAPSSWGKGYAREAARASIKAAARVDASRPVIARIRAENAASSRTAEAIGLVRRPDLDLDGEDGRDEVWSTAAS